MNIRLGIYDFFSRIVPGGFYMIAFGELARVLGWVKLDLSTFKDIGLLPLFLLLFVAYVVGTAMLRVGSAWQRIFQRREAGDRLLNQFKEKHADRWSIDFEDKDWSLLRSYLYFYNPTVAEEADRFNAQSIMFRNLSLGTALLVISESIDFFNTHNWVFLAIVVLLLFFSYQLTVQARIQSEWFYNSIYEAILASRLNLEERIKPIKASNKRTSRK